MKSLKLASGQNMPLIGFGTYLMENSETLKTAIVEHGYRHIDGAKCYGNEELVGRSIREAMEEGKIAREEIFYTTKCWRDDF